MANLDKNSKNMLIGAVLGGATGLCAASALYASMKKREEEEDEVTGASAIGEMEDMLSEVEKFLSQHNLKTPAEFARKTEKTLKKNESKISSMMDMVSAGFHLWNSFKR